MILEEIQLLPDTTDQLIDVTLSDNPYTLRILWNELAGYFSLTMFERDGAAIVSNVKMVKNYPLIGRFKDTRLPIGELFFIDNRNTKDRPTYGDIGTTNFSLIYYVPDVVITPETADVQESDAVSGSIWDSGLSVWDSGATTWD